jgi:hypothetical protein
MQVKNITHARSWDACPRSCHRKMDYGSGVREHKAYRKAVGYNINLQSNSATPEAGKPTKLILVSTEQNIDDPITGFDTIHDKLMHLVIVNNSGLSYFAQFTAAIK